MWIVEIDQNQLIVNILDINEFIYKNILKDIDLINSKINKYFNMELKLKILYKEEDKKLVEKHKKNVLQDKDNPLFMDVMNKFKGEILRQE